MKKLLCLILLCVGIYMSAWSQQEQPLDSVAQQELWSQPDFVRAYYVVAEPGGALYSVFGHACLHLVCPAYNLDYIFSYESENAVSRLLTFLAGNLQMGMTAVTTDEYLADYKAEGRGVNEYELNLPIEVKRELWRVLDEKVQEGMCLPYDFEARGCAYACVAMLEVALGGTPIDYGVWPSRFNRTRREIANDFAHPEYPWNFLCITSMVGADYDYVDTITEKLLVPSEVAEVWQHAKVNGEYLLSRDAHVLLPSSRQHKAPWFTPNIAALLLLLLAVLALFMRASYIDWLILGIVTAIGLLETYLVVVSSLPCTHWHWLLIPFNILPAICWKWRRYWSLPYVALVGLWLFCMIACPHQLVDDSMLILAVAFVLILLKNSNIDTNLLTQKFPRRGNV